MAAYSRLIRDDETSCANLSLMEAGSQQEQKVGAVLPAMMKGARLLPGSLKEGDEMSGPLLEAACWPCPFLEGDGPPREASMKDATLSGNRRVSVSKIL